MVFFCLFFSQNVWSLHSDFYKQKEKKKELRVEREYGAKAKIEIRRKTAQMKEKSRLAYSKERLKMIKEKISREKMFHKDLAEKQKHKGRKIYEANKYAKKRRRKKGNVSWKEQNLEYEIIFLKPKKN